MRNTPKVGRTVAIGDIHGCSDALAALIDAIAPGPDDTFITLGDYIDRGPNSRGVLDRLLALARRCRLIPLLGNHEEALLNALRDKSALKHWLDLGFLVCIDTNCARGGWLTALDVDTGQVWQANRSGRLRAGGDEIRATPTRPSSASDRSRK